VLDLDRDGVGWCLLFWSQPCESGRGLGKEENMGMVLLFGFKLGAFDYIYFRKRNLAVQ
jgi:hypothetical protein